MSPPGHGLVDRARAEDQATIVGIRPRVQLVVAPVHTVAGTGREMKPTVDIADGRGELQGVVGVKVEARRNGRIAEIIIDRQDPLTIDPSDGKVVAIQARPARNAGAFLEGVGVAGPEAQACARRTLAAWRQELDNRTHGIRPVQGALRAAYHLDAPDAQSRQVVEVERAAGPVDLHPVNQN